jgi:choline dehydrogenase-like flavoprotein
VENLFVAGSSVFPTGGYANPSLTILALTIRLADHIKLALRSFSAVRGPGVSCSTTDAAGVAVSTH